MRDKDKAAKKHWILAKWKSGDVYITPDGLFYDQEGRRLIRGYKDGITYRAKGSSKRYYYAKLNREKVLLKKVIKWPSEPKDPKGSN